MQQTFTVTGMTCGHCEKAVTRALKVVDSDAQVQIDRGKNEVRVESSRTGDLLRQAIQDAGYSVAANTPTD